jgi:pimeloyl-ACP methyl ester carboxylesterase
MLQHSDLPATGKSAPNVPLRRNTLTVRDGRRLAYIEQGAIEGIPVLFAHNMMYGVEWTPSALFAAEKRNIRIIAPSRPGFGFSDPLPGQDIDAVLDSAAADYCEVMDHLNIERAIIFGHGMASIYALRFARRYPHRVQALLAASHAPIWKDKWLKELPVRQRQVYTVARYAPQHLPFNTRAGAALIRSGNHDRFIDALTWNIPADIKAMKNKEAYDVMVRALHHTINQGCEAYCRECIIRSRDYVDEAQKLTMPMHILHGLGDVMVPPSRVELFCERVPESQVTWVENAGQYLLFTHWQHVLRKIEELA